MASKYGINDIVEMKNNMRVEPIVLKLLEWVLTLELSVKIVNEALWFHVKRLIKTKNHRISGWYTKIGEWFMALTAGIVGLPNVGKSTLFNAITKAGALAANYPFATIDPNVGIVEVPDARLLKLEEMVQPKKHYLLHLNLQILPELLKVLLKVKV